MTTPLLDIVTRRTALSVDGREVEISLVPGSIDTATPEAISFHLVGLHEKSDRTIPLPMLLRLAGYDVKLPKLVNNETRLNPADEIRKLFETPEMRALEQRVRLARGEESLL
jgi:hypothetical protein